jgi:MoaA/NifB/PqqE/SkfB family radical SAM enzyme
VHLSCLKLFKRLVQTHRLIFAKLYKCLLNGQYTSNHKAGKVTMITVINEHANSISPPGKMKKVLDGLDPNMSRLFVPWVLRNPRYIRAGIRLARSYRKTEKLRREAKEEGLRVPPFLILSITSRCNLSCAGCYAAAVGTLENRARRNCSGTKPILDWKQWYNIIQDASEQGVFGFIIAGGEPFLFRGLLQLCESFKDRFFIILTNGTALTQDDYKRLSISKNIAVITSVEGNEETTDARRGHGVHEQVLETLKQLKSIGVPTGISVTITNENFRYWMQKENLNYFLKLGVLVGVFIEYIPVITENITGDTCGSYNKTLMLDADERAEFRSTVLQYRNENKLYVIHSPGDEDYFGGCVSAGRGFAHVTPSGDLTACPVSNLATHNLSSSTFRDGLASPLFRVLRENEHLLINEDTPCALFGHPDEVQVIAESVGAYRTDSIET